MIDPPLVWAVPPVADLRGRSLPKAIAPEVITVLLASCDLELAIGLRDVAVLLLLARLGLRAGEVAAIRLEDIDWRAGEMLVHGKGHREGRCRCRSTSAKRWSGICRSGRRATSCVVLVRCSAVRADQRPRVAMVVQERVPARADPAGRAAPVRHTAATEMLPRACRLPRSRRFCAIQLRTTAIYARVDLEWLRAVARPWPGAVHDSAA